MEVTQLEANSSQVEEKLQFVYDNATTAGTIDNSGTFDIGANQQIEAGASSCVTGEAVTEETGSSVTGAGELLLQCGSFTVNGGSISSAASDDGLPPNGRHESIQSASGPAGGIRRAGLILLLSPAAA